MSDRLQSLVDKYRVSEDQAQAIFKTLMLPKLRMITPSNDPVAVIVGGQPGAGKSQVLDLAKIEFKNNIIICNADDYRTYHPNTKEILRLHEPYYPDITTKLAQNLNLMLRNECKQRGLHFALEITMRDGAGANATIQGIKNSGFTCNIDLLAVNEKWSRLGTVQRLENQRAVDNHGRMVSTEAHNDRYLAMPQAVKELADKKLYDNMRIFGRALVSVHDKTEQQVVLVAINPGDPASVLIKEQNRSFTQDEQKYFQNQVAHVAHLMKIRNAFAKEIKEFKQSFTAPGKTRKKVAFGYKLFRS